MLMVDTNVLLDIWTKDEFWADWSKQQLRHQHQQHQLVISPVVYAECAAHFHTAEQLDEALESLEIALLDMPRRSLFLASKAHAAYRQRGGRRESILADFFIGAHAAVLGCGLVTRDTRRYAQTFPTVRLIAPQPN